MWRGRGAKGQEESHSTESKSVMKGLCEEKMSKNRPYLKDTVRKKTHMSLF